MSKRRGVQLSMFSALLSLSPESTSEVCASSLIQAD